jgi:hypothetical protein
VAIELSAGDFLPTQKTSILFFFSFSLDNFLRGFCCSEFACSISFVIHIESRACRWPHVREREKIQQLFELWMQSIFLYIFLGETLFKMKSNPAGLIAETTDVWQHHRTQIK